jgi:hypothetical protein
MSSTRPLAPAVGGGQATLSAKSQPLTYRAEPMHRAPGITNGWMIFPSALSQPTRRSLGLGCEVAGMGKRF